ncbi:MAG: C_GCAxxG_C_C family protein [Calditrichaeota bacterium]|nr:MAG: C_GCAxxG_C_C family protein [Calditrichota bacterium]
MKTIQKQSQPFCKNKCNRRSFILKSIYSSIGITLSPSLLSSSQTSFLGNRQSKEDIYKQLDDLVDKYFPILETCSQTSFNALNQAFNLKSENLIKALASFPGIAFRGETCGAVSACLLGIALVYEEDSNNSEKQRLSSGPSINFCERFESEFGSTRCRDVIRKMTNKEYQVLKPEDYEILAKEGVFNSCPIVVKKALHIAADIILEKPNIILK